MERYLLETYSIEKKEDANGFIVKLKGLNKPVAEYDKNGVLTKILDWTSLPVQEAVTSFARKILT